MPAISSIIIAPYNYSFSSSSSSLAFSVLRVANLAFLDISSSFNSLLIALGQSSKTISIFYILVNCVTHTKNILITYIVILVYTQTAYINRAKPILTLERLRLKPLRLRGQTRLTLRKQRAESKIAVRVETFFI